jgi:hypothetical protein
LIYDLRVGRKVRHHSSLLERCFSRAEWEYLKRHKTFKGPLAKLGPLLDEFEKLCNLGAELLGEWESANPLRPKFKRRQDRKPGAKLNQHHSRKPKIRSDGNLRERLTAGSGRRT